MYKCTIASFSAPSTVPSKALFVAGMASDPLVADDESGALNLLQHKAGAQELQRTVFSNRAGHFFGAGICLDGCGSCPEQFSTRTLIVK